MLPTFCMSNNICMDRILLTVICTGQHGDAVLSPVASGTRFSVSTLAPCVEFACSPSVIMGFPLGPYSPQSSPNSPKICKGELIAHV